MGYIFECGWEFGGDLDRVSTWRINIFHSFRSIKKPASESLRGWFCCHEMNWDYSADWVMPLMAATNELTVVGQMSHF